MCSKNKKDYKKSKILFVRNSRCVSAEYRFWSSCALSFRMVFSEGPWQGMKRGGGEYLPCMSHTGEYSPEGVRF